MRALRSDDGRIAPRPVPLEKRDEWLGFASERLRDLVLLAAAARLSHRLPPVCVSSSGPKIDESV
jgi:hypothetical protein